MRMKKKGELKGAHELLSPARGPGLQVGRVERPSSPRRVARALYCLHAMQITMWPPINDASRLQVRTRAAFLQGWG